MAGKKAAWIPLPNATLKPLLNHIRRPGFINKMWITLLFSE